MWRLMKIIIFTLLIVLPVLIVGASLMQIKQTKQTYKPGPGLPNDAIYKIRPIYLELSKESELAKCLHGKTQNANESFNTMIWNRIPQDTFVSLPSLQFGVYNAVSNFNIGMKASVLTCEKLGFHPGFYTLIEVARNLMQ